MCCPALEIFLWKYPRILLCRWLSRDPCMQSNGIQLETWGFYQLFCLLCKESTSQVPWVVWQIALIPIHTFTFPNDVQIHISVSHTVATENVKMQVWQARLLSVVGQYCLRQGFFFFLRCCFLEQLIFSPLGGKNNGCFDVEECCLMQDS